MNRKIVVITGATGVGKTEFAIEIAKVYNGEIISADSAQVYKKFNIGTNKIQLAKMEQIPHYGIDIKEPYEEFSVYDFVNYASGKIDDIHSRGKLPIVVGGTGLYIRALVEGFNFGNAKKDEKFRKEVENMIEKRGTKYVYDRLLDLDTEMAKSVDPSNIPRLIRAYEIIRDGGHKSKLPNDINALVVVLNLEREKMYQRINARTEDMVKNGLVNEVKEIIDAGYGGCRPLGFIGYKECVDFLEGKTTEERMVELIKQHSRNYAKRQITYFKKLDNAVWVDVENVENALENVNDLVRRFLNENN